MDKYTKAFVQALEASGVRNNEIAKRIGVVDNYVSQWKSGRRPIPAARAAVVGEMLGIPPERISEAYERMLRLGGITHEDGMRSGIPAGHVPLDRLPNFDHGDVPNFILLPEFIVRQKIGITPLDDVRWVLQPTDAMAPLIPQHAAVLLDTRITAQERVLDGAVYAYSLFGRPHIRRILIQRDHWVLRGENPSRQDMELPEADFSVLQLHGLVVGWL